MFWIDNALNQSPQQVDDYLNMGLSFEYLDKLNRNLKRSEIEDFIQELEKSENPTTPPEPGLEKIKFSSKVVADLFDFFSGKIIMLSSG